MKITGHVRSLDGVRGVAIAAVMLYHGWSYAGHGDVGLAVDRARSIGWAGVDLFFVLSGFLITGILLETRKEPRYWRNFLIRRGLRIFPLYYAVLLVIVVGAIGARRLGLGDADPALLVIGNIWINFLYLTNFAIAVVGENHVPLDIAWSLAIEEQFYLAYPWLVRKVQPRTLLILLACAIAAAPIARGLTWLWGAQPVLGPYVLPYCRLDALALGALVRVMIELDWTRAIHAMARIAPVAAVVALVILYSWTRKDPRFIVVGYSTTAIAGACLLARLVTARPGAWIVRVFENPVLVYVGKISYGLYLYHLLARFAATFALTKVLGHKSSGESWFCALQLGGMIAIAMVVATLSYRYFERPLLAYKDRLAPPARAA
jgi:peptidoglycan/LPS O-acetylase OafA/YrhL